MLALTFFKKIHDKSSAYDIETINVNIQSLNPFFGKLIEFSTPFCTRVTSFTFAFGFGKHSFVTVRSFFALINC